MTPDGADDVEQCRGCPKATGWEFPAERLVKPEEEIRLSEFQEDL